MSEYWNVVAGESRKLIAETRALGIARRLIIQQRRTLLGDYSRIGKQLHAVAVSRSRR